VLEKIGRARFVVEQKYDGKIRQTKQIDEQNNNMKRCNSLKTHKMPVE